MAVVFDLILKWAVPVICTGIVGICTTIYRRSARELSALGNGVQALLRAEIVRSHKEYMKRGFCPIYAKESLTRTYKAYHDLGGNDIATKLYNDILELPEEEN